MSLELGQQGKQPQEKVRGSQFWKREEKQRPKLTIRIPFIQRPSENIYHPKTKEGQVSLPAETIVYQASGPDEPPIDTTPFTGEFNGVEYVDGMNAPTAEEQEEIAEFNTWPELGEAAIGGTLEDESGFHPQ